MNSRRAGRLTVVTALCAGLTPGLTAAAGGAQPEPISWHECDGAGLRDAGASCGTLSVPLDPAVPNGRSIQLAVSLDRASAARPERLGTLLVAELDAGARLAALPPEVRSRYDIVGFDPRGTGASRPALFCGPAPESAARMAYRPATGPSAAPGPNERAWNARLIKFADTCRTRYGDLLVHFSTAHTVADLERVRIAVAADRISVFDTGAGVGALYASRFPDRVERMVIDSPSDPQAGYRGLRREAEADESAFFAYSRWVARHHRAYSLGRTGAEVRARYYLTERKLAANPAGRFGAANWNRAFRLAATGSPAGWPDFTEGVAAFVDGRRSALADWLAEREGRDTRRHVQDTDTRFAARAVTRCIDGEWPGSYRRWRSDAFAQNRSAKFSTWSYVPDLCRYWDPHVPLATVGQEESALPLLGSRPVSMLLLASDARLEAGMELRRRFPGATLIWLAGRAPVTNAVGASSCVDEHLARYLAGSELPRSAGDQPDFVCARLRQPTPCD